MSTNKKHTEEARAKAKAAAEAKASEATLRDEFAKAALTGLVSLQQCSDLEHVGRMAYAAADAAILARDEASEETGEEEMPKAE